MAWKLNWGIVTALGGTEIIDLIWLKQAVQYNARYNNNTFNAYVYF